MNCSKWLEIMIIIAKRLFCLDVVLLLCKHNIQYINHKPNSYKYLNWISEETITKFSVIAVCRICVCPSSVWHRVMQLPSEVHTVQIWYQICLVYHSDSYVTSYYDVHSGSVQKSASFSVCLCKSLFSYDLSMVCSKKIIQLWSPSFYNMQFWQHLNFQNRLIYI